MKWIAPLYWIIAIFLSFECSSTVSQQCMDRMSRPQPYPADCSRYYECLYGRWRLQQCLPGELFDTRYGVCVQMYQAQCYRHHPNTVSAGRKNMKYVDSQNIHWSLEPNSPQDRSVRQVSKTKVSYTTHTINGQPTHTVFTVYHNDKPSYRFNKSGDVPKGTDLIQWVKENSDNYEKEYIPYMEDGTTAAFIPPPAPTAPPTLHTTPRPTTQRPRPPVTKPSTHKPQTRPPDVIEEEEEFLPTKCGLLHQGVFQFKVTQGKESPIDLNPWQVALLEAQGRSHLCGGSIITNRHVISAAHCFYNKLSKSMRTASEIVVRVGDYDKNIKEDAELDLYIYELFVNNAYSNVHRRNDIALLVVTQQIVFNAQVFPICVPEPQQNNRYLPGRKCVISGWGSTEDEDKSRYLKSAVIPLVDQKTCGDIFPGNISKGMFCAGNVTHGGVDTCQGDSGGPLVCKEDNERSFLFGITSWGVGCGAVGKPGVYTKVSVYRKWIMSKIKLSTWTLKASSSQDEDVM